MNIAEYFPKCVAFPSPVSVTESTGNEPVSVSVASMDPWKGSCATCERVAAVPPRVSSVTRADGDEADALGAVNEFTHHRIRTSSTSHHTRSPPPDVVRTYFVDSSQHSLARSLMLSDMTGVGGRDGILLAPTTQGHG